MSQINEQLMHGVPMGEALKKLFPDAPKVSEEEAERIRAEEQARLEPKLAQARAEALLAHVRELGDDY